MNVKRRNSDSAGIELHTFQMPRQRKKKQTLTNGLINDENEFEKITGISINKNKASRNPRKK